MLAQPADGVCVFLGSMLARADASQLSSEQQAALGFLIQVGALRLASASDAGMPHITQPCHSWRLPVADCC